MSAREFLKHYMTGLVQGKSQEWVAEKCGVTRDAVCQRASSLRKRGIDVPKWHRGGMRFRDSAEELNKYIGEFNWSDPSTTEKE